jgi:hypothetical protein
VAEHRFDNNPLRSFGSQALFNRKITDIVSNMGLDSCPCGVATSNSQTHLYSLFRFYGHISQKGREP